MLRVKLAVCTVFCLTVPALAEDVKIPPTSTPEQIEAFKDADNNGDGALTQPEFRTFIESMADQGEPTAKFIRTFAVHSIAFAEVDRDRDGFARPFEIYHANSAFEKNDGAEDGFQADR